MVREISELVGQEGSFAFHMASLNPLNPDNAPDKFETEVLKAFEVDVSEIFTREQQHQGTYFRYMVPLMVEFTGILAQGKTASSDRQPCRLLSQISMNIRPGKSSGTREINRWKERTEVVDFYPPPTSLT